MSASKLLQLLEQSGMLEKSLLLDLRKQVAESKYKVSAESIAKLLVDKGHLTKFQATRFVGQATEDQEEPTPIPAKPAPKPAPRPVKREEEDLGLAPEDAAELGIKAAPPAKAPVSTGDDDVVILEDAGETAAPAEGLTPVVDAGEALVPVGPVMQIRAPQPVIQPPIPPEPPAPILELEPLGPELDSPASFDPFAQPLAVPTQPVLPARPRQQKTRWDSMLIWGGSLALALLLLFGGVLWYNLSKTPPLEMFEAAMKDYREESYSQAVAKFQNFLKQYPEDEKSSEARVRVALAQLRLAAGSPETGLQSAKELIPTIASEAAFQIARDEFVGILPQIPEGFVRQAKTQDDMVKAAALLAKAEEGMKLVLDPANIPTSLRVRIETSVQRIQEDMALVQRAIDQDKELGVALGNIEKAAGENDTRKAYQFYRELVKKYPSLDANQRLNAALLLIGQRERGLVKVNAQNVEAARSEDASAVTQSHVLAIRTGDSAPGGKGLFAAVLAGSSVFGINVENGHVVWRRFVGPGIRNHPQRVSEQPNADVLCVNTARQELLRYRVQDGAVVWRLPVKETVNTPVIAGKSVYLAAASGRLWEIDAESGRSGRQAVIPQKLISGPAVAPNRPLAFQPGEHSNIYVISTDTLECKDVYYLGQRAGAIDLPPLVLSKFLFVVENAGSDYSLLHTLSIRSEGDGPALKAAQAPIRLTGSVRVPLIPYGRRLLATTDRGEICVFDIDVSNATEPVKEAAKLPPVYNEPVVGYPLADGSSLWIADNRLTNYRIQVTTKEIARNPAIANVGDTFVAPLQLFQNTLVHTRRVKDSAGTTISAVSTDNPRKPLWETCVGLPVSLVSVNPQNQAVTAVTAAPAAYSLPTTQPGPSCLDEPTRRATGAASQSFTRSLSFDDGSAALISAADVSRIVHFVPGSDGGQLAPVEVKAVEGRATSSPAAFRQSLLLLTDKGSVRLIDPKTGEDRAMPYQPKLEPGETIKWLRPASTGGDAQEFFAADDRKFLYRIGLKEQPQASLSELASVRIDEELSAGLAALGTMLFAVSRTSSSDVVLALNQSDLKIAQQSDLKGGRVTWGPERAGDSVLVAIDGKTIQSYGPDGKPRWAQPATSCGQPAGSPLQVGSDFVFASVDGQVWRLQGIDGRPAGKIEVGEPLSRGPVACGDQLLLCGSDGTILVTPVPTGSQK